MDLIARNHNNITITIVVIIAFQRINLKQLKEFSIIIYYMNSCSDQSRAIITYPRLDLNCRRRDLSPRRGKNLGPPCALYTQATPLLEHSRLTHTLYIII